MAEVRARHEKAGRKAAKDDGAVVSKRSQRAAAKAPQRLRAGRSGARRRAAGARPLPHALVPARQDGRGRRRCRARFRNPERLAYHKPGLPALVLYKVRFKQGELWGRYRGTRRRPPRGRHLRALARAGDVGVQRSMHARPRPRSRTIMTTTITITPSARAAAEGPRRRSRRRLRGAGGGRALAADREGRADRPGDRRPGRSDGQPLAGARRQGDRPRLGRPRLQEAPAQGHARRAGRARHRHRHARRVPHGREHAQGAQRHRLHAVLLLSQDAAGRSAGLVQEPRLPLAHRASIRAACWPSSASSCRAGVEVRVHDSTADLRYIVLPMRPKGTRRLERGSSSPRSSRATA